MTTETKFLEIKFVRESVFQTNDFETLQQAMNKELPTRVRSQSLPMAYMPTEVFLFFSFIGVSFFGGMFQKAGSDCWDLLKQQFCALRDKYKGKPHCPDHLDLRISLDDCDILIHNLSVDDLDKVPQITADIYKKITSSKVLRVRSVCC